MSPFYSVTYPIEEIPDFDAGLTQLVVGLDRVRLDFLEEEDGRTRVVATMPGIEFTRVREGVSAPDRDLVSTIRTVLSEQYIEVPQSGQTHLDTLARFVPESLYAARSGLAADFVEELLGDTMRTLRDGGLDARFYAEAIPALLEPLFDESPELEMSTRTPMN